jgi:hypothetical protein
MRSLADCDATSEAAHHLTSRVASYGTRARGEGTHRAYRSAWRAYAAWCTRLGREPLGADPDTVAMYAVRLADDGRSVATLRVHLVAIQAAHRVAGLALDLGDAGLRLVLEGIVRSTGIRPRRQAAAATPDLLRKMLATRPAADTPLGGATARCRSWASAPRRAGRPGAGRCGGRAGERAPGEHPPLRDRSAWCQRPRGDLANPAEPSCCPLAAWQAWTGFRRKVTDACGGASDAALPLFVG